MLLETRPVACANPTGPHRLSTIRAADQILVLSEGRVAERGTHDELLGKGGLYTQLSALQFDRQD